MDKNEEGAVLAVNWHS